MIFIQQDLQDKRGFEKKKKKTAWFAVQLPLEDDTREACKHF